MSEDHKGFPERLPFELGQGSNILSQKDDGNHKYILIHDAQCFVWPYMWVTMIYEDGLYGIKDVKSFKNEKKALKFGSKNNLLSVN